MANRNKKTSHKYSKDKDSKNKSSNNKKNKEYNADYERKSNSEEKEETPKVPRMNNAKWYMPSDFLMNQHNYSMEGILGIPFDMSDSTPADVDTPTIMSIIFQHTPGDTSRDIMNFADPKSAPVNVAAKYLYTTLSSRNKKTTNYQPQDIALAIFAESELISMFALGMRVYGVALQLNSRNRDIPRKLIKAMGFDPDDVMDNMTKFRNIYNVLAQAANALKFVGNFKAFEKAWALFANYYADENADMCQYIVPSFDQIGVYTEAVDPSEPSTLVKTIKYESIGTFGSWTVNGFFTKLKKMIDNLQTSTLMNYVYADLINYMVDEGATAYQFSLLPDMFLIAPEYNELFLTQVHNLEIRGIPTFNDITQDPTNNIIETHISWKNAEVPAWDCASIVDFPYTNDPTVEEKIDALMFKSPGTSSNVDTDGKYIPGYHTAIDYVPKQLIIFTSKNGVYQYVQTHFNVNNYSAVQIALWWDIFNKFRSAPILYWYDNTTLIHTTGEMNTVTRMKYSDMKEIFDQGNLGLFTFDAEKAFNSKPSK